QQELDEYRAPGPALRKAEMDFPKWAKDFIKVNAELIQAGGPDAPAGREAREQVEKVWRDGQPMLTLLVGAGTAEPRGSEVAYHLALCTHERAARTQTRGGREAEEAWKEALYWWDKFETNDALTAARFRNRLRLIEELEAMRALAPIQLL